MRGLCSIALAMNQMSQLRAWTCLKSNDNIRARNSRIILHLADRWTINQVAKEEGLCRQTVSDIRRAFLIFGIDGIKRQAPRLGRHPTIKDSKAHAILDVLYSEAPQEGRLWTVNQLARRCDLSPSLLYRFLRKYGVDLNNPHTFKDAGRGCNPHIIDIGGLFINNSIQIMAFLCKPQNCDASVGMPSIVHNLNQWDAPGLFTRECDSFLSNLEEIRGRLLTAKPNRNDSADTLLFLDILREKARDAWEVLIIGDFIDSTLAFRLERWLQVHQQFHFTPPMSSVDYIKRLGEVLDTVKEDDKRIISLQLENINLRFIEWTNGPLSQVGTFAWTNRLR